MPSCAFFGHSKYQDYSQYRDKIKDIVFELIQNHGVTQFYNGYRGDFDRLCAILLMK